ncbi:MAG: metallophosphoesterase family protein [Candidatus Hodarchaeales archaeon]|jgi:3',5'-cyclic AMP phosphodiesterase CpdA
MKNSYKFLIISDLHIGGKFNEEMFNSGINYVNTNPSDFVICCGDLTDNGTIYEYELAQNYMKRLNKPYLIVPGNHDTKNVGDLLWEEMVGPRYFVETNEQKKIKILGLDSTEPDRNSGWLGGKSIERIYHEFNSLGEDWLKVVVFHHQTLPIPFTGRERSALDDAGDALKAIMDNNIQLVLNGHRHISNVFQVSDGDLSALIVNAGTLSCKKTRYREEYSVTSVEINKKITRAEINVVSLNNDNYHKKKKFNGYISAAPPPTNKELLATLVQIGKTDFSNDKFNLEMFARGVKAINNIKCDLVIHCGNVTGSSYFSEFKNAKALLQQIMKPLVVLPGPQDSKPLGLELFPEFLGDMNPIFRNDELAFFGFNTCKLDSIEGRLGRSNLIDISKNSTDKFRISVVALHHTIIPIPRTRHEAELADAGDVLSKLSDLNINLVLTGAKNRPNTLQVNNTIFVNTGTLSSFDVNTRGGNSFNIISIYKTELGIFYEIAEVLLSKERAQIIGQYHVPKIKKQ